MPNDHTRPTDTHDVVYQNSLDISLDSYLEYQHSAASVALHMPADIIHLNDLLRRVLVTSYLNFDLFAGSYRLRCALLWSGLAVAILATVVVQVNMSRLDVTALPTAKPVAGKSQSCQHPVIVVATRWWS